MKLPRNKTKIKSAPRIRWWIGIVYLVLLALVIPWYWPVDDVRHVYGLPYWAISTLALLIVTSIFTAWVYLSGSDDETE